MDMKRLWRYSGTLLMLTGGLHILVFGALGYQEFMEILSGGFINTVGGDFGRSLFWYGGVWLGVTMILFGAALQYYIKQTGTPPPRFLGYGMLAMGLVGGVVGPASGSWLIVLQGVIIIMAVK
jgi:hypothetical protein